MGEINGIKHTVARRDSVSIKVDVLRDHTIANMNRRVQTQALLDDLIEQRRFFQSVQFIHQSRVDIGMLTKQGKRPCQ